jgi:hypothetical protein
MMNIGGGDPVGESDERIQDALAAHLEYLEMGGREPDTSHLTDSERAELADLIGALEMTEGVSFGLGRRESRPPATENEEIADTERQRLAELVLGDLRESLPADIRVDSEPVRAVTHVGGLDVLDGWLVGTFGGRIRVWLLAVASAEVLEANSDSLSDLNRLFGSLPDTSAVALVATDLSCLVVRPEDCAPQIHIPSGSLVGRRYKQPIRPVGEAVFAFLNELIPYWDPIPAFDPEAALTIDVATVGDEFVNAAIERQRGIGQRARKGNPKKDVLLDLGKKEAAALAKLANGLLDGSVAAEDVEQRIERLAQDR